MKKGGFTLIEMMIVLVILAVLLMVALPAYQNSVIKSNRAAARGVLMDVASRQEQFFINNKSYTNSLTDLGLPADYYIDNQADRVNQAAAIYQINLSTVNGYTLSAVPLNRQTKDTQCQTLTLSGIGVKTASGSLAAGGCW